MPHRITPRHRTCTTRPCLSHSRYICLRPLPLLKARYTCRRLPLRCPRFPPMPSKIGGITARNRPATTPTSRTALRAGLGFHRRHQGIRLAAQRHRKCNQSGRGEQFCRTRHIKFDALQRAGQGRDVALSRDGPWDDVFFGANSCRDWMTCTYADNSAAVASVRCLFNETDNRFDESAPGLR